MNDLILQTIGIVAAVSSLLSILMIVFFEDIHDLSGRAEFWLIVMFIWICIGGVGTCAVCS